jgi:hypothetical protein
LLFRLGPVLGLRKPGLRQIIRMIDVLHRVSLRIGTMPHPVPGHHHPRQCQCRCLCRGLLPGDRHRQVRHSNRERPSRHRLDRADDIVQGRRSAQRIFHQTRSETDKINIDFREILDVTTVDWGIHVTLVWSWRPSSCRTPWTGRWRGRAGKARADHQRRVLAQTPTGLGSSHRVAVRVGHWSGNVCGRSTHTAPRSETPCQDEGVDCC